MGCCTSTLTAQQRAALEASLQIDEKIREEFIAEQSKIKLLLLGAGESGKSTIFKQMKIIYKAGFTDEERRDYIKYIHQNVLEALQDMCNACTAFGYATDLNPQSREAFQALSELDFMREPLTPQLAEYAEQLWNEPGIQKSWERRSEYQVIDSIAKFMPHVHEIAAPDFFPSDEDILLARVRTIGVVEDRYVIDGIRFAMFDVGGQRNERKKWIHCFDEVHGVLFVAAVSEYDRVLFEDEMTNRMVESINLFSEVCTLPYFEKTSMILFLNKSDLFREKIAQVAIADVEAFADYAGAPNAYEDGIQYFVQKFHDVRRNQEKKWFHHVTCATDTSNVAFVFNACKDIVMSDNLAINSFFA